MKTFTFSFADIKLEYRPGTSDEAVLAHSFKNDIYYPNILEYVPHDGDTIIDIGAHIGTFSLLTAHLIPRVKIHSLEASHESFNLLKHNLSLNPQLDIT